MITSQALVLLINCIVFGGASEVCFDEVGCFNNQSPWNNIIIRPKQPLPENPHDMAIRLHMYTKSDNGSTVETKITRNSTAELIENGFNGHLKTVIIVHGFKSSCKNPRKSAHKLLQLEEKLNVFCFNWEKGCSGNIQYEQAVSNSRVAGHMLYLYIEKLLLPLNGSADRVHLVGHSLGAHVVGYSGKLFTNTKINRITGLDPAGPYFEGMPHSTKLYLTDANYVDIIHTDCKNKLSLGIAEPLGHMDFYANGGLCQPGCKSIKAGIEIEDHKCSHHRAVDLFADSIDRKSLYIAHRCSSFNKFLEGNCNGCGLNSSNCAVMGYHSTRKSDISKPTSEAFYFTTAAKQPYQNYHFALKIHMHKKSDKVTAKLTINAFGNNNSSTGEVVLIGPNEHTAFKLKPKETYNFILRSNVNLTTVGKLQLRWKNKDSMKMDKHIQITSIEIKPIDQDDRVQEMLTKVLYPISHPNTGLPPNVIAFFLDNN